MPTETTLLLQKGIAAARSGRSSDARQMLEQVVESEPGNEMAWLWLSGLMTTIQQKRACLERVLQANPENVYARAGLTRLQDASLAEADILEARLASVTSGHVSASLNPAPGTETTQTVQAALVPQESAQPTNGREEQQPWEGPAAVNPTEAFEVPIPELSQPAYASLPNPAEPTCPACDEPISHTAKMCPYCLMPLRSVEELLGDRDQTSASAEASSSKQRRRGILGYLGFSIVP